MAISHKHEINIISGNVKYHLNRRRRFWHATHDCVAPYVDIILHRGRFWAKSAASGSVRWLCFRSCWMVLSHVMRERPSCLLQSAGGEANRILLASALSSMRIMCPNKVSRHDWIIAVSLGCFVSLRTSSFRTNWYHLVPSSIWMLPRQLPGWLAFDFCYNRVTGGKNGFAAEVALVL